MQKAEIKIGTPAIKTAPKPLPYWLELVEALSKENRSAMGMRDGSRGYLDAENGRVLVRFGDKFTMKMMSGETAKAALALQISTREGKNYPPERIDYEYVEKTEGGDDFFDSLDGDA